MCSFCRRTYKYYLLKHDEASCPFKQSQYCPTCACYGHLFEQCPDPLPALPPRLKAKPESKPKTKPILELVNQDDVLKSFLQAQEAMPARSVKSSDLRKLIRAYADKTGRTLNLIPC